MDSSPIYTLNLWDSNFAGQMCSVANQVPKWVRYVRNKTQWDGVTLFTDGNIRQELLDRVSSRYRIGWLHEAYELHPENYNCALHLRHLFDMILTYDSVLLTIDPRLYRFMIRGGTWITPNHWGLHPKGRHLSLILSEKRQLEGHQLRHTLAEKFFTRLDLYGALGVPIKTDKALGLADYHFSVVVEAVRADNWFTESLLDCIALGTVPVYWGCPNVGEFFEERGILSFKTEKELAQLLPTLTEKKYESLLPYLSENLKRLEAYAVPEDWMVRYPLKELLA